MRTRPVAAFVVGLSTAVLLAGCLGQAPELQNLADRLDGLPGVVSARAELAGGVVTPAEHRIDLVLDPALSEDDARRIARLSCEGDVEVAMISIATKEDSLAPGTVLNVFSPESGTTCLSEPGLVRFAQASAAMQRLGAGFEGTFGVSLEGPEAGGDDPVLVTLTSTDRARLAEALRDVRSELPDVPLDFRGSWDEDGDPDLPDHVHLAALLSADTELAPFLPLVERAQELGTGTVAIADGGVTVELRDDTPEHASAELTALADQAGLALTVQPPLPPTARPIAPWE
ncbi:hypothetical protein [Agromyces soli]|uniref:Uncharacterized protein n=1 Tax=Agromyces soli TaxID=659012 RepID=A0ABY4AVC5_9MICO|nr:hypothetical protein [Agromyces soli]UOE27132.1 hypothetical protein MTP13_04945 [Agromyces soli]